MMDSSPLHKDKVPPQVWFNGNNFQKLILKMHHINNGVYLDKIGY